MKIDPHCHEGITCTF